MSQEQDNVVNEQAVGGAVENNDPPRPNQNVHIQDDDYIDQFKEDEASLNTLTQFAVRCKEINKNKRDAIERINQAYRDAIAQVNAHTQGKAEMKEQVGGKDDIFPTVQVRQPSGYRAIKQDMSYKQIKDLLPLYYKPLVEWATELKQILIALRVLDVFGHTDAHNAELNFKIILVIKQLLPGSIRAIVPWDTLDQLLEFLLTFEPPTANILSTLTNVNTQNIKYFYYHKKNVIHRAQPSLSNEAICMLAWEVVILNSPQRLRELSIVIGVDKYPSVEQLDKLSMIMSTDKTTYQSNKNYNISGSNSEYNKSIVRSEQPQSSQNFRGALVNNPQMNFQREGINKIPFSQRLAISNNSMNKQNFLTNYPANRQNQQQSNVSSPTNNFAMQQRQSVQANPVQNRQPQQRINRQQLQQPLRQSARLREQPRVNYRNAHITSQSVSPSRQWGEV